MLGYQAISCDDALSLGTGASSSTITGASSSTITTILITILFILAFITSIISRADFLITSW